MTSKLLGGLVVLVFGLAGITNVAAMPVTIDFEAQATGALTAPVVAGGVATTFSCGSGDCFVIGYGSPLEAYSNTNGEDGLPTGFTVGARALSNDNTGPSSTAPYQMVFSEAVANLSLLLVDLDFGQATLSTFSDSAASVLLAAFDFTSAGQDTSIMLSAPVIGVRAATIAFSAEPGTVTIDPGTAIDNLSFTPLPLPSALSALGTGIGVLMLLGWWRRRSPIPG